MIIIIINNNNSDTTNSDSSNSVMIIYIRIDAGIYKKYSFYCSFYEKRRKNRLFYVDNHPEGEGRYWRY